MFSSADHHRGPVAALWSRPGKGLESEMPLDQRRSRVDHYRSDAAATIADELVGNAIKFTDHGGIKLLAAIDSQAAEPRFVIEIHDTGIGIPADQLDRIFSPFEQADGSITRRFGGTGLGLTICQHIAEGLGGSITVESQPGQGSVFRVTLEAGPLEDVPILESLSTEARLLARPRQTGKLHSLSSARILLVEDGDSSRELIRLVLQEHDAASRAQLTAKKDWSWPVAPVLMSSSWICKCPSWMVIQP